MARRCAGNDTDKDEAAQRAAANRRYYVAHPEIREKNRLRIAERREAKKRYRRQWDARKILGVPATHTDAHCDTDLAEVLSEQDNLTPKETTAHAALSAMYRLNACPVTNVNVLDREPRSLAEIAAYESSESEDAASSGAPEDNAEDAAIQAQVQRIHDTFGARARMDERLKARLRLDAEKAARMRVVVETDRAWDAVISLHEENGSRGVERWLETVGLC
ncbi:hypothetical protein C8R47DRAFT_1224943 [Mycena vitilis]|nr:hypothetical protein C8R47DRAFT_1224931 [Mycena vitilis]KAJ6463785.1 hypothetical protein C8R47DRAFT_1224943 [Mycena vitilis]